MRFGPHKKVPRHISDMYDLYWDEKSKIYVQPNGGVPFTVPWDEDGHYSDEEDEGCTCGQCGEEEEQDENEDDEESEDGDNGYSKLEKTSRNKTVNKKSSSRKSTSRTPPKKTSSKLKVSSKAEVSAVATDELDKNGAKERLAHVSEDVVVKIKKALALGSHEGTGEAEAKRAMKLASYLMAKHSVEQADILAAESEDNKLKRAGQSIVTLTNTDPTKRILFNSWSGPAVQAVTMFFNCKAYSTQYGRRIDWTFYGLAEQTVAAAYAFEMVYNLILVWSAQNKAAVGRAGKNNYCHGVARGLYDLAKKERKAEETQAVEKEKARIAAAIKKETEERENELKRLRPADKRKKGDAEPPKKKVKLEEDRAEFTMFKAKVEDDKDEDMKPLVFGDFDGHRDNESSDDDSEGGFPFYGGEAGNADFRDDDDVTLDRMLEDLERTGRIIDSKPDPAVKKEEIDEVKVKPEPVEDGTPWESAGQLIMFRQNAENIADDFLKQQKRKIRKKKRSGPNISDKAQLKVYKQGKEDAKKIDIKRKRIEDEEE